MATSGTATFNPDFVEIVEEASEIAELSLYQGYALRSARRAMNLLLQSWSNKGINLWTVEEVSLTLTANTLQYTLDADVVDLLDHKIRLDAGNVTTQVDLDVERISLSQYASQSTKLTTGRPTQIYLDRQVAAPIARLWPVPDGSQTYTLVYWKLRRIEDVGAPASNTIDVPARFLPALVWGLAFYLAAKHNPQKAITIKPMYDELFADAAATDRDRSTLKLRPGMRR